MTTKQTSQLSSLKKSVAPYEKNDRNASIRQLINTLGPLVLLWGGAYFSLSVSYWLTLLLAIPATGFVIGLLLFSMTVHMVRSLRIVERMTLSERLQVYLHLFLIGSGSIVIPFITPAPVTSIKEGLVTYGL